ncbi:uncharacterized protein FOBCDRAFT_200888 [Fusarium oxysporum Fo47]|uniref:uncharacterized protein n=1 Tax=Fusarium oxysporum Fo47 TaxID=660027 RepID=UPI0028698144|nr:uncharacterized protein FOBCDRAFT_200888 [Fusarium oxysporum Fo47]QKD53640.2 hypothetical protein FOBCDRAFT_200888 [Fusarium oxysporum Fo47]
MENNKISEARFAEIMAVVGSPFEFPPSVYMQRLEEETKRGNSLVPFLNKTSRVDTTPRQSPKSWLEKLATTDFVMERRKDKTSTSSLEPTEYVLVIDAVAPGHPVWLIYNRNSINDIGEPITASPADPDTPLAFKYFPTVNDWVQSYGNVDRTKFEESIKATCITGAVEVKELPLAEAEEHFRQ